MKQFDKVKTIQLIVLIVVAAAALITLLGDAQLYHLAAEDPRIRRLCGILWMLLAVSFAFLFYDFNSFADLRRENLELDQAVYSDALTGIANRYSVDAFLGQFQNGTVPPGMGCVTLDLTSLTEINKMHGHAGGDAVIRAFSGLLAAAAGEECFLGRNGGNKFVAIFRDCPSERLEQFLASVRAGAEQYNAAHADAVLRYTAGVALASEESIHTVTELVACSDQRALQEESKNLGTSGSQLSE